MKITGVGRLLASVIADVLVGALFSLGQIALLIHFRVGRDWLAFGGPISLAMGPVLFMLLRRTGKTGGRIFLDAIVAVAVYVLAVISVLSIGRAAPSIKETAEALILFSASLGEAALLIASEDATRRYWVR